MKGLMNIGDRVIIRYNGDIVHFGQCYDGMTGKINYYYGDRYSIALDVNSRRKINEINYRTGANWTTQPTIPFPYIFVYNKNLELE